MHWEHLLLWTSSKVERAEVGVPLHSPGGGEREEARSPDPQRSRLQQKILRLTEQMKEEQTARDDHVAQYLELAQHAGRQHAGRIKQVFEKKNQRSAQTIAQLQRKLDQSRRRLREVELHGRGRQPKDVLRDVTQGLKDVGARVTGFSEGVVGSVRGGLSAAGAVVPRPREIASLLRHRFSSADHLPSLRDPPDDPPAEEEEAVAAPALQHHLQASPRYGSEDDCSSATSGSLGANSTGGAPGGPPSSRGHTLERRHGSSLDLLLQEVQELREGQARLEEVLEGLKVHYQRDYSLVMEALQEERYRCERLEEQLNDLTELHQNEMVNLQTELTSLEEKIAYQSSERAGDLQEALEACQTRISKMELQQQQGVQLEGVEGAAARTLLGRLINVLLALMALLLLFVSSLANCLLPLMRSRLRSAATLLLLLLLAALWRSWGGPGGAPPPPLGQD